MAFLLWNCRGLGKASTFRALRNLVNKHKPSIVFLMETKQRKSKLDRLRSRLHFHGSFYIDPVGIAGGLALWWKEEINLTVLSSSKNYIDTSIAINDQHCWYGTFLYGSPYLEERADIWANMSSLRSNDNILDDLFSPAEVRAIQSIPIGNPDCKDSLIWPANKNGIYSARSGYFSVLDSSQATPITSQSNDPKIDKNIWKSIWKLHAPPKIRSFIWKLCYNAVATKENLHSRFHLSDGKCPRCHDSVESVEHVLFFCPHAQAVWKASDFNYCPSLEGFPCFAKWWLHLFYSFMTVDHCHLSLVAFVCWFLWKSRNALVFQGSCDNPIEIWHLAARSDAEFKDVNSIPSRPLPNFLVSPWQSPPADFIKVNCDASFDHRTKKAGLAAIFRNSNGEVVGGSTMLVSSFSVVTAEALACRLGVVAAFRQGWKKIILESDNEGVISRLLKHEFSCWESASVEADILSFSFLFDVCSFSFVRRSSNGAADWLAKNTRNHSCPRDWVLSIPPELASLL
ncbi:hypothetical protein GQ457_05G012660 [Hibiscus cannabinus]